MILIKKLVPKVSEPLHIKHRPKTFEDVIGQDGIVTNLARLFDAGRVPHSFLFTGPSGCGKTTLARIIAAKLHCLDNSVIEVDAARYSGIDAMRELLIGAQYQSLGDSRRKFYIIDEAHSLRKATWQTLLKNVEEPSPHLYWAFCTTEPEKVPDTIRTRCHAYDLKPVKWDLLSEYLTAIRDEEKLAVKDEFIDIASRKAQGSVRQGLVYLSMLDGIVNKDEALRLVEDADAQLEGPIVLARLLLSGRGATWDAARKIIEGLDDISPESIRLTVLNYATAALQKESGEKNAVRLLAVVQTFSSLGICNQSERMAPILVAVGSLLLGE